MAYPQAHSHVAKLVRLACEIADAHAGSLFLKDDDVLRPYVLYNLSKEYVDGIGLVRVGTQCCGRAVEAKKPWVVADMLQDPLFTDGRKGASNSLIRAGFSVPVFQDDEVVGSLACHYTAPYRPTPADIDRNEHFARLIAITLKGHQPSRSYVPIFVRPSESASFSEMDNA